MSKVSTGMNGRSAEALTILGEVQSSAILLDDHNSEANQLQEHPSPLPSEVLASLDSGGDEWYLNVSSFLRMISHGPVVFKLENEDNTKALEDSLVNQLAPLMCDPQVELHCPVRGCEHGSFVTKTSCGGLRTDTFNKHVELEASKNEEHKQLLSLKGKRDCQYCAKNRFRSFISIVKHSKTCKYDGVAEPNAYVGCDLSMRPWTDTCCFDRLATTKDFPSRARIRARQRSQSGEDVPCLEGDWFQTKLDRRYSVYASVLYPDHRQQDAKNV